MTEIVNITDRELAKDRLIVQLAQGRDALAARLDKVLSDRLDLKRSNEALERDAARYRFLESDFSPMGLNIDGNHAWAYRRNATLKGPTLKAAIDAALKGHHD